MAEPNERLRTLTATNDGFLVAQKDLELRGAGEFFGTRQHGEPRMPALMLTTDTRLLHTAREAFLDLSRDEARQDEYRLLLRTAQKHFDKNKHIFGRN